MVETNVSGQGIGASLIQEGHPIAFISKALLQKYRTLFVYEKEMLALPMAMKKWESYLINRHFIVKIDHQSLKYLLEQSLTTSTQQAWMAKLMQFDYKICYKQGKENVVADALSCVDSPELMALTSSIMSDQLYKKSKKHDFQICISNK